MRLAVAPSIGSRLLENDAMHLMGRFWSSVGRVLGAPLVGRVVVLSGAEGPYGSAIEGLLGTIHSINPVTQGRLQAVIIVAANCSVVISGKATQYFAAVPRHEGYGADALRVRPIAVNLVSLENPSARIEYDNFVSICMLRLQR